MNVCRTGIVFWETSTNPKNVAITFLADFSAPPPINTDNYRLSSASDHLRSLTCTTWGCSKFARKVPHVHIRDSRFAISKGSCGRN